MLKVLQILGGLNRGGMETFIMNVYRKIDRHEIQFDFLLRESGGAYEEEARSLGANIYYSGSRREDGVVKYWHNLDFFFREHVGEYNAVHYHESTLTAMEPLYYAKKYGIKNRILHSHSSSVSGSKLHYITHTINKLFVKNLATIYLGCSEKAIKWFYRYTGVLDKAEMIDNGIDVSKFSFNVERRNFVREKLGINKNTLVIGHIGRFVWIKNHKFLLEVFKELLDKHQDTKLLLIGQGPLFEDIKSKIHDMEITESVMLLGLRADIPDLLQAIDAVVMPSFYEGLPVSLVEAQAAGTLVFGSDTISKDTAITPNMHFLSLDSGAVLWADNILKSMNTYVRSDKSSRIVRDAGYDINMIAKKLVSIYKG